MVGFLHSRLEPRHVVAITVVLILIGVVYYAAQRVGGAAASASAGFNSTFSKFDGDEDGAISQEEMQKFHAAMDSNGDGKVTKGEVAAYARKLRAETAPPTDKPAVPAKTSSAGKANK